MPMPVISLLIYKKSLFGSAAGSRRGVVCFGTGKCFSYVVFAFLCIKVHFC